MQLVAAFQGVKFEGFVDDEWEDVQRQSKEASDPFQPTAEWRAANAAFRQLSPAEGNRLGQLLGTIMKERQTITAPWSNPRLMAVCCGFSYTTSPSQGLLGALRELAEWVKEDREARAAQPQLQPLQFHCHRLWWALHHAAMEEGGETFADIVDGMLQHAYEERLHGGDGWGEVVELVQSVRRE